MFKKETVAMLLAGGQGSRLGILTETVAKPAVSFGGKYKIIDFPLSNCINSGIDTVGVLTQYQPLQLTQHIGIGIPWDLDRNYGGVTVLSPFTRNQSSEWYSGTANAVFQNIPFIDTYNPEYVLILSGDHIYKMDYEMMLTHHKMHEADATIAVLPVPIEEASRFGIMNCDEDLRIVDFEEKPAEPKSNLASMGIYIFNWQVLRKALIDAEDDHGDSDFGKHVIPRLLADNKRLFAFTFEGYWRDVGTLQSYWEANMQLVDLVPEFNLYESYWKIYTKGEVRPPQYIASSAVAAACILGEGTEVYGTVRHSIIGRNVFIEAGAEVYDSIIMDDVIIREGARIYKSIVSEKAVIGAHTVIGEGEDIPNERQPHIYNTGISVVGTGTEVPSGVVVGKNCAIDGLVTRAHFPGDRLESGKSAIEKEVKS